MTAKYTKPTPDIARAESAIAKLATAYPNVTEDRPWGHSAFKISGKTFLFLYADGDGLSFSVKLPQSGKHALTLGFTEPTHYGLGKSGWVTARIQLAKQLPLSQAKEWLDESFRAIAPKKVVATLSAAATTKKKPAAPRRTPSPAPREPKASRSAPKKRRTASVS